MSAIYVLAADGTHLTYDELQVCSMLDQGLLSPDTLYWREGMPEWRPLRGWQVAHPKTTTPEVARATYSFQKDPGLLTTFVKVSQLVLAGINLLILITHVALLVLIKGGTLNEENAGTNDSIQQVLSVVYLIAYLVAIFLFLKWVYRANLNCHGFGTVGMQYTPGWCIGYYFVPLLNLVRPYQTMREIWQVSANPKDWESQPGSPLLGFWWFFYLGVALFGNIYFRLTLSAKDVETVTDVTIFGIVLNLFSITLCLLRFVMVGKIYDRQKKLVEGTPLLAG